MEIGRLEFYATKRDRNGRYFGKIYPYNKEMRNNYDNQLVFFHESRIPWESALRRDGRFTGYRYMIRRHGRTSYERPVYVAFEAPLNPRNNKEASATVVMLLEEADPNWLPNICLVIEPGSEALISVFPGYYTLSRIGLDLLKSEDASRQLDLMKACWDRSSNEERQAFIKSLEPDELVQLVSLLIEIDKRGRGGLTAPMRTRQALAIKPGAALIDDVAFRLTPNMWTDEFLSLMKNPGKRRSLLALTQPPFQAYAIAKCIEASVPIHEADIDGFVDVLGRCDSSGFAKKCLLTALANDPALALRTDVSAMLTPETWVDDLLSLMADSEDRERMLENSQPAFRSFAVSKYLESGGAIDEGVVRWITSIVRGNGDASYNAQFLTTALRRDPRIALRKEIAETLTPNMWTDDLLSLLRDQSSQEVLLPIAQPSFTVHAVSEIINAGLPLYDEVFAICPLRSCPALWDRVKWSSNEMAYAEMVGNWLSAANLYGAEDRKSIVLAAERMRETNDLLSPIMWHRLPAVMRIRLLIFWSNHYNELDDYAVRGGITQLCVEAYKSSWSGYSPTLKAALLLFALPLSKNAKRAFLDANDALIGEIVRQFNGCTAGELHSFTLGDEMQALLQRCAASPYVDESRVRNFCDAREWKSRASIWCHKGTDRPKDGRQECKSLLSPINACEEARASNSNLENQFLADLLVNVCKAMEWSVDAGQWLGSSTMDLVEYAYRVSSYVNKMALVLPHMVCRGCGVRMVLNYKYPRESRYKEDSDRSLNLPALSATVCFCPNLGDGNAKHDTNVYINYCKRCRRVIDSRECKITDSKGYYLCMYCGGSEVYAPAMACPNCGNTDPRKLSYYTGSMKKELHCISGTPRSGAVMVACKAEGCMYDARKFVSVFDG